MPTADTQKGGELAAQRGDFDGLIDEGVIQPLRRRADNHNVRRNWPSGRNAQVADGPVMTQSGRVLVEYEKSHIGMLEITTALAVASPKARYPNYKGPDQRIEGIQMKAAVYERYGPPDVVEVKEVEKPTIKDVEVLIRIRATTVSSGDWRLRSLNMPVGFGLLARPIFGFFGPKQPILGSELAGDIEAVGKDVTKFKIGDAVFAFPGASLGCHAEYRAMSEDGPIALKPTSLSYEEAAALSFGGTTALDFLRPRETSNTAKRFSSLAHQERWEAPRFSLPSTLGQR